MNIFLLKFIYKNTWFEKGLNCAFEDVNVNNIALFGLVISEV